MLVNLTPKNKFRSIAERHAKYMNRHWRDVGEKRHKGWKFSELFTPTEYVGVYWNADMDMIDSWCKQRRFYGSRVYWEQSRKFSRDAVMDYLAYEKNAWTYGTADNLEQVVQFYNDNKDNYFTGHHVILCYKVVKKPEEPCSGWRWHKHGEYIGTQNPKCEYLNDEPEINEVICFSIVQVV